MRTLTVAATVCVLLALSLGPAAAQDVLARARAAQTRAEALVLLETHLVASPRDVDARTLYGLMLSWERRFDDARRELQQVLTEAAGYTDARAGLMNVEWWSGNSAAARYHSDYILRREPGHAQARLVRQRLDAADRPWAIGTNVVVDSFTDDRSSWHESMLTLTRQTPAGAVIARASRASRFDLSDQQLELEFYPVLRPGTYAFVGAGVSPDHALYPGNRLALELYQALGHGFEASAGYRRLAFDNAVDIYVGALSKYAGNWLVTGRVNYIRTADAERSLQLQARRYFGSAGTSFAGLTYGRGANRAEIRGEGDLLRAGTNAVRAELNALVTSRVRLQIEAGASRTARTGMTFWQRTAGAGASIRF